MTSSPWERPSPAANRWIAVPAPRPHASIRLFCFPYAGGAASTFYSWPAKTLPSVEVCAIQLPGRASRFAEAAFVRLPALVSALEDALMPALDRPFAFFGHSMGALVAFELTRRLRKTRGLEPLHLFVSGAHAPHVPRREAAVHGLPEAAFLAALRHLDATPSEVLESPDLMAVVGPAVRADFAVCETYTYVKQKKLTCPITVFGGRADLSVTRRDLDAWASETRGACVMHVLTGGHHFLRQEEDRVLAIVSAALARDCALAGRSSQNG
jgi:medium-chain acyl-[acyl-carrier-protein] hydrolase